MDADATRTSGGQAREALLWGVTLVAFSPVLVDLGRHALERPWALYPLAFWLLFARRAVAETRGAARPALGIALILAGLALELVMLRAGWPRMGRPGWLAASLGVCLMIGRPGLRTATLLLWWIPIPHALVALASPGLESLAARMASAGLAPWIGPSVLERTAGELVLTLREGTLRILDSDGGVPLATLLAGFGWHRALQRAEPLATGVRRAVTAALLALPLQAAFLLLAVLCAGLGAPERARSGLDLAVPIVGALALLHALRPMADGYTRDERGTH